MSGTFYYKPPLRPTPHVCNKPGGTWSDVGPDPQPAGAIWKCNTCGQYWKSRWPEAKWWRISPPKGSPDFVPFVSRLRRSLRFKSR